MEGMILYGVVVNMKILDVKRMMETKIGPKGGKDGDWREERREGEHGGQEMWKAYKNKGRRGEANKVSSETGKGKFYSDL